MGVRKPPKIAIFRIYYGTLKYIETSADNVFIQDYNERNEGGNNPEGYTTFAILELCKVIINGK
jgi:hypothetical protein